jgi:hypothetical protein
MGPDLMRAGPVAAFGMAVSLLPLAVAVLYLLRPSEQKLSLMRPLSLATIFAALHTFFSGVAATFRWLPALRTPTGYDIDRLSHGLAETAAPLFVAFGVLTVAWLCVALGMRRTT